MDRLLSYVRLLQRHCRKARRPTLFFFHFFSTFFVPRRKRRTRHACMHARIASRTKRTATAAGQSRMAAQPPHVILCLLSAFPCFAGDTRN